MKTWPAVEPSTLGDYAQRALRHIEGKTPKMQLALLSQYVDEGQFSKVEGDDLNVLRRAYIRIASSLYRERVSL